MRTLGISISRHRLDACFRETSFFKTKALLWRSVLCEEPFGGPGDIRRLAEELRREAGGALPPAILSVPPSWTYLRRLALPVADLGQARAVHVADIEGDLPVGEEEILSDLLPPPPSAERGRFLAVAARRTDVEKVASAFVEAGIPPLRIVTDHVSALCAALASKDGAEGVVASFHEGILVMRISGEAVLWARHFPELSAGDPVPPEILGELRSLLRGGDDEPVPLPLRAIGDPPPLLAADLAFPHRIVPPGDVPEASPLAWGAAISPDYQGATGGFSLRTSAAEAAEEGRKRRRVVVAAAAGAVALVSAVAALETARWAEGRKVAVIRAQIGKEFSAVVPGVRSAGQETLKLRDRIHSLDRQRKELGADYPSPVGMLAKVSRVLPAGGSVTVRELSFDAGRLRLDGEAASSAAVEELRAALAGAFGAASRVTVQESGGARSGSARFTILVEPEGAPGA